MSRNPPVAGALALLLSAGLAGCPLPQPLPEYPTNGIITPPRIQSDQVTPGDTVVLVDASCSTDPTAQVFVLSASLVDENTFEQVEARWFIDYDPQRITMVPVKDQFIPGPSDGVSVERSLDSFYFAPYMSDPADPSIPPESSPGQNYRDGGGIHVVELVVSNNFAPEPVPPAPPNPKPYRTPLKTETQTFETQVYRWVFHYVPAGTSGARCSYP
jgi:hypothetical protein